MFLKKNATWTLDLKDDELSVIRKCLRGDDLTPDEDLEAERLVDLLDRIVEERARPKQSRRPGPSLAMNG